MPTLDDVLKGIATTESGGNKNPYDVIGPKTGENYPIGKYQVMASNVPEWTKEATGKELTPEEFRNNPDAQEKVARHKIGQYIEQYGADNAARVWFGGTGALTNPNAKDVTGTTVDEYAKKVAKNSGQKVDYTPISEDNKRRLIALGYNPDKYQENLNKGIEEGGNKMFDAYKSYYKTNALISTPTEQSTNAFMLAQTNGAPVVKTVYSTADDFKNSFTNSLTEMWAHIKEAGIGIEHAVGLTTDKELQQQTRQIQKDKAFQMLRVSANAQKDPFSLLEDGSINWHGLGAAFGGMLGGLAGFAPAAVAGAVATVATGGADIPVFLGMSAATITGAAATGTTMALDGYGSGYEEGLQRGLTNDQAATFGAIRAGVYGTIGSIPGGIISKRLFGAVGAEITDKAINDLLDKGFTKEAFARTMPELQDGIAQAVKRRLSAAGHAALEESLTVGGVMGTQSMLDHIASVQYAQHAGEQDKFRDVLDKTNEEVFKDVAKSAFMGSIMGTVISGSTLLRGAAHPTMYGYVEENLGKPEKLEQLKTYIQDYGQKAEKPVDDLVTAVDDMKQVASTYRGIVKSPDARYQIWKLQNENKLIDADTQTAQGEIEKLKQSGADPAIIAPDVKKWTDVISFNEGKKVIIEKAKAQIGETKNPIDYNTQVTTPLKELNNQLDNLLKPKEDAISQQKSNESLLGQQGIRGEGELQTVEQGNQEQKPTGEGEATKEVTLKDVLDIPFTVIDGVKGRLSVNGDMLEFTSDTGKVTELGKADEYLDKPLSEIQIPLENFDSFQLEQKKAEEQPVTTDLDKYFETPKEEPDEQHNAAAEQLNNAVDESAEAREEAKDIIGVADAIEAKESVRRKGRKGTRKKVAAGTDTGENRQDVSQPVEDVSREGGETEQTATAQGDKTTEDKGQQATEPTETPAKVTPAIEVNGKVYEGANHGEAMDKAREAGEKVPDWRTKKGDKWRTENGKFKDNSTGEIISREESDKRYGISRSEEMPKEESPQDKQRIADAKKYSYVEFKVRRNEPNTTQEEYRALRTKSQLESESAGKPIEKATAQFMDKVLKKVFPNIKTNLISGEEFEAKHGEGIGVLNPDGTIDINTDKVTAQTQIHEMGHVWTSWAKKFAPELYERGMKLAEKETGIHEQLKKEGYDLEGDALHEETLARMIGEAGEQIGVKEPVTLSAKAKAWVKDLWNKLTTYVKQKLGIKDNRFDDLKNMPFKDFVAGVARELLSGKEISAMSSEELAAIESDGISRYQLEPDTSSFPLGEEFTTARGTVMNTHPIVVATTDSPVGLGIRNILKTAREVVGDSPEITREHVIKVADEIGKKVDKYLKDKPNRLSGMKFIEELHEDIVNEPEKFRSAIKELLDEHLAKRTTKRSKEELYQSAGITAEEWEKLPQEEKDKIADTIKPAPPKETEGKGTFSMENLSPDAKDVILSIGDFMAANEAYEMGNGRIITGNSTFDANPNETRTQTLNTISPWINKLQGIADKNKYTKKAFDKTLNYALVVAHPQTWAVIGTGGKNGNLAKLARSIIQADGKKFVIAQNASEIAKPYTDFVSKLDDKKLNDHPFNPNETLLGAKLTDKELFKIFMSGRQKHVQDLLNGGATFRLPEREGRKAQSITIYNEDFGRLQERFGGEEAALKSHDAAMDYTHSVVEPVYKTMTGLRFNKEQDYHPLINIAGNENNVEDYVKRHNEIGDTSSHKRRDKSLKAVYLVEDPLKTLNRTVEQSSKYASYAYPVHNGDVLMGYTSDAYVNAGMGKQVEYWNKFKTDLSNPDESQSSIEKFLMRSFTLGALGMNPFVSAKHLSTIPLASGVIKWKYLASSIKEAPITYADFVKNSDILRGKGTPKEFSPLVKEAMEHSDFFRMRMSANTSEIQEVASNLGKIKIPIAVDKDGNISYKEMSGKDAMWGLKTMETSMGAVLWDASKKQVAAENPELQQGTDKYWKKVDEYYTDAVIASQPSFSIGTKPAYMRGGFERQRSTINRALSLFGGQAFAQFNFMEQKAIEMMNNPTPINRVEFAKAAVNVFVINSMLVGGINVIRQQLIGGKHKDTLAEESLNTAVGELPIAGPIMETLLSKIKNPKYGYDFNYPPIELINGAIKGVADAANGNENELAHDMMSTGFQLTGIPATPIKLAKAGYEKVTE